MSFDTTMTQSRNGAQISTSPLAVRLDNMSMQEASYLGGAAPYDSFWLFTPNYTIDVRRGDLFTDTQNTDPKTGANAVYRVFGNPERFDFDHVEIPVEKVVGT